MNDAFIARISSLSDELFHKIYIAVIGERRKREMLLAEKMPHPSPLLLSMIERGDYFDAYAEYRKEQGCSITMAKRVFDLHKENLQ